MKQYRVMTLSLLLAVGMAVTIMGCGGDSGEKEAPKSDEPAAAEEPSGSATEPAAAEEPSGSATEPAAAAEPSGSATEPAAGGPLTAATIVGTSWDAEGKGLTFEKDGVLKVKLGDTTVEGTWSIDGTTLTAGALGQSIEATIEGDKIMVEGQPLARIQ